MKNRTIMLFAVISVMMTLVSMPAMANNGNGNGSNHNGGARGFADLKTWNPTALIKGGTQWVPLNWEGKNQDLENFSITVKNPGHGVTVAYPGNGSSASVWDNSTLSEGEIDFTAFQVHVPSDFHGYGINLVIRVEFTVDGKIYTQNMHPYIKVTEYTGDDVVQVNFDIGSVEQGETQWSEVYFKGLAPQVENFQVFVVDEDGVPCILPQGDFTSLHANAELDSQETDVVRMFMDTAGVDVGTHTMTLKTTWEFGGQNKSMETQITFTVTG